MCTINDHFEGSNSSLNYSEITFNPGQLVAVYNITITDDDILEYTENYTLSLSVPEKFTVIGVILGEQMTTTLITIYDNDGK